MSKPPFAKLDIDAVLTQLRLEEKIALLAGHDMWHTTRIPRLGIPSLRASDGPNGVRGTRFFEGVPASCFPSATGLGASWDTPLLERVGQALGVEAKAKGAHILLGPTINIQRSPLGGRGFECYSEDPFLSGTLAHAYIKGVQSEGVAATIKHYVANDQENQRKSMSSEVSARALREIYLRAFEIAVRGPNASWALMTAYNRVNGLHVSEDKFLLDGVLRDEWKWKGLIMSDWFGVYSISKSVQAGLDLEMPGPTVVRGDALLRAMTAEKVFQYDIDARVRNVLELVNKVQPAGVPEDAPEASVDTPELRALMREAAASSQVLLKNDHGLLPLSGLSSIAVVGPDAKVALISGGGSAALRPTYTVTPFDAICTAAKEAGITQISYARGGNAHKFAPLFGPELRAGNNAAGVDAYFYNEDPSKNSTAEPVYHLVVTSTYMFFNDGLPAPPELNIDCWAIVKGTYTPEESGDYEFGLAAAGLADLYLDDEKIIDNSTNPLPGELFFNRGSKEVTKILPLEGGKPYKLLVRFSYSPSSSQGAGTFSPTSRGGLRFGVAPFKSPEAFIDEAVQVATLADAVILLVGLNADFESEGHDRTHMKLPSTMDRLTEAIISANHDTVVVVQSGTPVEMPWASHASSIVQAFYGGNEVGNGIADVLFGKVNPSGRLPLSFPVRLKDNPTYLNFGGENGKVHYAEGIFVGYRHYDALQKRPLFPFGHGLSYTTFGYSSPKVSDVKILPQSPLFITVKVTNTGNVAGREVVQVYISDSMASLQRPPKELKAFTKTRLLAPGESEVVSVSLDPKIAFGFYDDRSDKVGGKWVAEKGKFRVIIPGVCIDSIPDSEPELELDETFAWV